MRIQRWWIRVLLVSWWVASTAAAEDSAQWAAAMGAPALPEPVPVEATPEAAEPAPRTALVNVTLHPKNALLRVDQLPTQPGPLSLQLGEHVLEANAEGYLAAKRVLQLKNTQPVDVDFVLKRPPIADTGPVERREPLYKNPWLWAGVTAAVVAAVVVGVAVGTRDKGETHTSATPTPFTPIGVMLSTLRAH